MTVHLRGIALLAVVMLVLLGVANWASPVLDDALGPEGAIQAVGGTEPEPGSPEELADLPLTSDEIVNLQTILSSINYDTGGVDGIVGPKTRAAIDQAKLELGMEEGTSNRRLLERLIVLTSG